jgi:hypothetical protein
MLTSDAIKFFEHTEFTDAWGFNVLIEDLRTIPVIDQQVFEDKQEEKSHIITDADLARPEVQAVIGFLEYQIQAVLFPVIRNLLTVNAQVVRAGEVFKDELDAATTK